MAADYTAEACGARAARAAAWERRFSGYAIKFVAGCGPVLDDCGADPTDANLEIVLARCARRPDPSWCDEIRRHVAQYRRDPDRDRSLT